MDFETLDKFQVAPRLLEDIRLPMVQHNYRAAVAAIEIVQKELNGTPYQAYQYLIQQAEECRDQGIPLNFFWLSNAEFWPANRKNWKENWKANY